MNAYYKLVEGYDYNGYVVDTDTSLIKLVKRAYYNCIPSDYSVIKVINGEKRKMISLDYLIEALEEGMSLHWIMGS